MYTISFNFVETLAFASILYWIGVKLCQTVRPLEKYNLPPAVVGGLLFALIRLLLEGRVGFKFDMVLMEPFMVAFFATIGMGASAALLKRGGRLGVKLLVAAAILLVIQNAVALLIGYLTHISMPLALLAGSATMTGGHGTGFVFAQNIKTVFSVSGAGETAIACATFGIVTGSLLGGPMAETLIKRNNLAEEVKADESLSKRFCPDIFNFGGSSEQVTNHSILMAIFQVTFAASIGIWLSGWLGAHGVTFPSYAIALICGALMRNIGDNAPLFHVNACLVNYINGASMSFFLALALMSIELISLRDLAVPLLVILAVQVVIMALFARYVTFRMTGSDYQAAVVTAGHCGFGLGATPNAIANMEAVCSRYGAATDAFFAVAAVGAFFIDLINVGVIQFIIALLR